MQKSPETQPQVRHFGMNACVNVYVSVVAVAR